MRILALDGGGVRGVFSAAFLAHLEEHLALDFTRAFDLLVGTSTGAIIALSLAAGRSAREVLDDYREAAPRVFGNPRSRAMRWLRTAHSNTELVNWLRAAFGDKQLVDASVPVCITSLDCSTRSPRVWKTSHHPDLHYGEKQKMWQVALASAAAPTYLPAVQIDGAGAYVDGGLWGNNPSIVAITEAVRYFACPLENVKLLSVGTGRRPTWMTHEEIRDKGKLGWASEIVDLVLDAQSATAHNQAQLLLGQGNYLRINVDLARPVPLDDARQLTVLENLGREQGMKLASTVREFLR